MKLSICNQFEGRVTDVTVGDVLTTVKVQVGQDEITAAIAAAGAAPFKLLPGTVVQVLISATDVMVTSDPVRRISTRNRLPGLLTKVRRGPVATALEIALRDGDVLRVLLTQDAVEKLELRENLPVTALVRSTEVNIAVP